VRGPGGERITANKLPVLSRLSCRNRPFPVGSRRRSSTLIRRYPSSGRWFLIAGSIGVVLAVALNPLLSHDLVPAGVVIALGPTSILGLVDPKLQGPDHHGHLHVWGQLPAIRPFGPGRASPGEPLTSVQSQSALAHAPSMPSSPEAMVPHRSPADESTKCCWPSCIPSNEQLLATTAVPRWKARNPPAPGTKEVLRIG
jgi:hypothetical protein